MHACNSVLQATARGFQHGRVGGAAVTLRDAGGRGPAQSQGRAGEALAARAGIWEEGLTPQGASLFPIWTELKSVSIRGVCGPAAGHQDLTVDVPLRQTGLPGPSRRGEVARPCLTAGPHSACLSSVTLGAHCVCRKNPLEVTSCHRGDRLCLGLGPAGLVRAAGRAARDPTKTSAETAPGPPLS